VQLALLVFKGYKARKVYKALTARKALRVRKVP
jgi:hypothetical protein